MSCLHRIWFHPRFFPHTFQLSDWPPALCATSTDVNHPGRGNKINLPAEGCDHTCIRVGGRRSSGSPGSGCFGMLLPCIWEGDGTSAAHTEDTLSGLVTACLLPLLTLQFSAGKAELYPLRKSLTLLSFLFFAYQKFRCYYCEEIAVKQPGRQGAMLWQMSLGLFPSRGLYSSCFFTVFIFI